MNRLAIVGAGAAGVATFIAAVRAGVARTIYMIDPHPVGPGTAFSNTDRDILCNTSVDTMSVLHDVPLDFLEHLSCEGYASTAESFVPRFLVGRYLANRFVQYSAMAREQGVVVKYVSSTFKALKIHGHRHYELEFVDSPQVPSSSLMVTDVVFCTGFGPPRLPLVAQPFFNHSSFIKNPYPEASMLAMIPEKSRVLVMGSKLSAIDSAIVLCRDGHQVTMLSPSGEFPAVRARFMRSPKAAFVGEDIASVMAPGEEGCKTYSPSLHYRYVKYFSKVLRQNIGKDWSQQFSYSSTVLGRLKEEVEIAESGDSQWQEYVVDFMHAINGVHNKEDVYFDGSFHPRFERLLYRYITALALPNARKLLKYIEDGVLCVQGGEISAMDYSDRRPNAWNVSWGGEVHGFDTIVAATGYYQSRYVMSDDGRVELDVTGERGRHAITILPSMAGAHESFGGKESIWFVGAPARPRVWVPNALVVVTPLANQVIESMRQLPRVGAAA